MKSFFQYTLFLSLILSFTITSCDSDSEGLDDSKGIQFATTRSGGESEGIGLACNFGEILKEHFEEIDFDEIKEEVGEEGSEEFDKDKFDEFLEEFFGSFKSKTMYMITAGDDINLENKEEIQVAGEAFSLHWYSDIEEPSTGTYEAFGAKFNIEDPEDLENGAEVSYGKIEVNLTDLTDELMIGTFSGKVTSDEGVEESIEGTFNVERVSCTE